MGVVCVSHVVSSQMGASRSCLIFEVKYICIHLASLGSNVVSSNEIAVDRAG